jgi:hypothetical protein
VYFLIPDLVKCVQETIPSLVRFEGKKEFDEVCWDNGSFPAEVIASIFLGFAKREFGIFGSSFLADASGAIINSMVESRAQVANDIEGDDPEYRRDFFGNFGFEKRFAGTGVFLFESAVRTFFVESGLNGLKFGNMAFGSLDEKFCA